MLSRKLVRQSFGNCGGGGFGGERTPAVAVRTLVNFSDSPTVMVSANNARDWNSTSFCPSLSISSRQLKLDSKYGGCYLMKRVENLKPREDHLFRHCPINLTPLLLFTSPLSISWNSSGPSTICRKYHSLRILSAVNPLSGLPALVQNKCTTTLRLAKESENSGKSCLTLSHCRLFSSDQGKGDQSESINSPKTSTTIETPIKSTITIKDGLQTRTSVKEFLDNLTDEQKGLLYHSLNVHVLRDKYEGHLGSSKSESHHYLSRFGRPTAAVGEEPTGTLCEVPPKWLHTRLDEKMLPPPAGAIWAVGLKNALPFVGFGFLDNLIMILAGDYIDVTIGTTLGISTMAAAALGNTISDVAGIGSAWYVEELANRVGIKDPQLTPSQFASWPIRWASNGGRAIGVVIGCLLGMVPLLFLPSPEEKEKEEKAKVEKEKAAAAELSVRNADSLLQDKKDKGKN